MVVEICTKANKPERRRTPRMPYCTAAHYKSAALNGVGTIKDISSDGMFLENPFPLDAGTRIRIAFQFRNSKHPMNITGEIARGTPAGFGVKFLWP